MSDDRNYKHYSAEWGWIAARQIVWDAAIHLFGAGKDAEANILRELVNNQLVIRQSTFEKAPREHCEEGCTCGVNANEAEVHHAE